MADGPQGKQADLGSERRAGRWRRRALTSASPPPALAASRAVAGAQPPLAAPGRAPAACPLRPHGRGHTARRGPVPPPGPGQRDGRGAGQRGPGVPPEHLRTARVADAQDAAALPVRHAVHHRREEARGLQGQGAALLRPRGPGERPPGRRGQLERAGAHARGAQPPLRGRHGRLPLRGGRGRRAGPRADVRPEDRLPLRPPQGLLGGDRAHEELPGALRAGSRGPVPLRRRGQKRAASGAAHRGAVLPQEEQVDVRAGLRPLRVLPRRICG